jgi:hypothetical protein
MMVEQGYTTPTLRWSPQELYTSLNDGTCVLSMPAARRGWAGRAGFPGAIHLEWTKNLDAHGAFQTGPGLCAM